MSGFSDYSAQAVLNWQGGNRPAPTATSRFLALFTAAPTSDAGTGGTEVSGGSYARVQVAGTLAAGASFTTSSSTITLGSTAPAWLLALGTNGSGVIVWDVTQNALVGTVTSVSGTTATLSGNSSTASSGAADSLLFSAFSSAAASTGTEPAVTPASIVNGAAISFAQSTASWGDVIAWGLYDAVTSGNMIAWDYMGNYKWSPFSCTLASPGVITVTDQTFTNGASVVVTAKFGGAMPTTAGSWVGLLTVAGVSGNTFNVAVNTTSIGDGLARAVTTYTIGISTTMTIAASSLTLSAA